MNVNENHFYCPLNSFLKPMLEADVKVPWLCAGRQGSLRTMSKIKPRWTLIVNLQLFYVREFSMLKLVCLL